MNNQRKEERKCTNCELFIFHGGKGHCRCEARNCADCIKMEAEYERDKADGTLDKLLSQVKEDWKERFWSELGNPDKFSSASQFNPAFSGQLPNHILTFISKERQAVREDVLREVVELIKAKGLHLGYKNDILEALSKLKK